jgi:hypothetical protein
LSVVELFRTLKEKPSGHEFTASKIKGWRNAYLAVNSMGHPALIVETNSIFGGPSLKAARVSLKPSQELAVTIDGNTASKQIFHILICESSDRSDVANFLVLIEAFLASRIGLEIAGDDLSSFFRSMIRLFAMKPASDLDARRQGLWGELFMMRQVLGYRFWAPYWHGAVTGLFDFSAMSKHIEVKSSIGQQRIHHFSHKQIWESEGEEILIASLVLRQDDSGLSLRELVQECREALRGTPDYLKLEFAVRHAGMEDDSLSGPQFSEIAAEKELLWFRATDAPHFRMPEPPGVSETNYKVDLTRATPISAEELNRWLVDWGALPVIAEMVT